MAAAAAAAGDGQEVLTSLIARRPELEDKARVTDADQLANQKALDLLDRRVDAAQQDNSAGFVESISDWIGSVLGPILQSIIDIATTIGKLLLAAMIDENGMPKVASMGQMISTSVEWPTSVSSASQRWSVMMA